VALKILSPDLAHKTELGGVRYLYNTYSVANHTGAALENLTFYTLSRPDTLGGTAIKNLRDAGGALLDNPLLARSIRPTHRMIEENGTLSVKQDEADFQAFTSSEALAVQAQLAPDRNVLEYGYVARNEAGVVPKPNSKSRNRIVPPSSVRSPVRIIFAEPLICTVASSARGSVPMTFARMAVNDDRA
jgi:hypothetical protein